MRYLIHASITLAWLVLALGCGSASLETRCADRRHQLYVVTVAEHHGTCGRLPVTVQLGQEIDPVTDSCETDVSETRQIDGGRLLTVRREVTWGSDGVGRGRLEMSISGVCASVYGVTYEFGEYKGGQR